ncbi:ABC transporter permease [Paenibacillus dakarensis]|uniref:ABC transporter permease n=1 Tax=Paenibacillus dakarensis TaxID=1527293 RepID=UPI0006D58C6A|nr:ABC transporter permease subunit [Paenibacillus dakarensis]
MNSAPATQVKAPKAKSRKRTRFGKSFRKNWELYLLISPVIAYFIIFDYLPMYGVQIAFKNFMAAKGIWASDWIGLDHFVRFFKSFYFEQIIFNTISISLYQLAIGFPFPLLLALLINEVGSQKFKRFTQTVTYAPHFLSTVVMVGLIMIFLSPQNGIINHLIDFFGGQRISFMIESEWFKSIYVFSGVWQGMGWSSIIYLAALAGIDPTLHEAARVDGASRLRRIWHINLPGILPTVVILLILNVGQVMSVGFEKIYLMQNDLNIESSEVISTYVYKQGIIGAQYSFSAAVGLFNSVINLVLLVTVNRIAKKVNETSLW